VTDELKTRLQDLVADQPAPTVVPSEAVFTRVRTIRRRRAIGAAALATTAVTAAAVALGNLTGYDSAPPITTTPSNPATTITTPPPATPPTVEPRSTATLSDPTGASVQKPPPVGKPEDTAPPEVSTTPTGTPSGTPSTPPAKFPKTELYMWFFPKVEGMTASMTIDLRGTVLAPTLEEGGEIHSANLHDNVFGEEWWWGDNTHFAANDDAGVSCMGAQRPVTGPATRGAVPQTHTYAKPGNYLFGYRFTYCSATGPVVMTRVWEVVVPEPTTPTPSASPSP
jgi:hypothetical protein